MLVYDKLHKIFLDIFIKNFRNCRIEINQPSNMPTQKKTDHKLSTQSTHLKTISKISFSLIPFPSKKRKILLCFIKLSLFVECCLLVICAAFLNLIVVFKVTRMAVQYQNQIHRETSFIHQDAGSFIMVSFFTACLFSLLLN